MSSLKLGLIGCGRIAQHIHLPVLTRLPGVALVALAESDPGRREEARRRAPAAAAFAEYHDLLAMPEVEAVVIALPPALHAGSAVAAFAAGKHVYLEKPLATDLAEGRHVLAAWRRSGRVGMIGFNYRFHPLHAAVRRHVEAGELGELIAARTLFCVPARELPAWKRTRAAGGGVLLDLASHHVDLLRFLLGREVRDVSAQVRSHRVEADTAAVEMTLEGGVLAQSFFSMSAVDEDRFEIIGGAGRAVVDRYFAAGVERLGVTRDSVRLRRVAQALRALACSPVVQEKLLRRPSEPSYAAAFSHFAAAARGVHPASPDLEDGYRSLIVTAAAEQSARTGQRVRVAEVECAHPAHQR